MMILVRTVNKEIDKRSKVPEISYIGLHIVGHVVHQGVTKVNIHDG